MNKYNQIHNNIIEVKAATCNPTIMEKKQVKTNNATIIANTTEKVQAIVSNAELGHVAVQQADLSGDEIIVRSDKYNLTKGGLISVKFTQDVPAGAKLNVSEKGSRYIKYNGQPLEEGVILNGDTALLQFNGRVYDLLSIDRWEKDIKKLQETNQQLHNNVEDLAERIKNIKLEGTQSDWFEANITSPAYIRNKPTIPSASDITELQGKVSDLEQKITTKVPTKLSELTNDVGYLKQETDPTIPSWAKQSSKPTYSASEILNNGKSVSTCLSELDTKIKNLNAHDVHALPEDTVLPKGTVTGIKINTGNTISPDRDGVVTLSIEHTSGQVQSDWEEQNQEAVSYINNKPTIPTKLSELQTDDKHLLVTYIEKQTWNDKQNALQFDDVPTMGSQKLMKSGDIYNALQNIPQSGGGTNIYIVNPDMMPCGGIAGRGTYLNAVNYANQQFTGSNQESGEQTELTTQNLYFSWILDDVDSNNNRVIKMIYYIGDSQFIDALGAPIVGPGADLTIS